MKKEKEEKVKKEDLRIYIEELVKGGRIALDAIKIKEDYPEAYSDLYEYLKASLGSGGEKMEDDMVISILIFSVRSLYEYFDSKGLYINIVGNPGIKFSYDVGNTEGKVSINGAVFENRILTEIDAFNSCFKYINNNLINE